MGLRCQIAAIGCGLHLGTGKLGVSLRRENAADFHEPHCPFWGQNGQCGLVISTGYRMCDSVLYHYINWLAWPDPISLPFLSFLIISRIG